MLISFATSSAQSISDSIPRPLRASIERQSHIVDSLISISTINQWRDSLAITVWSERLRKKIHNHFSPDAIARSADSLRMFGVPEPAIARRTDSLLQRKVELLKEVEEKQNGLQRKVTGRYTTWSENLRRKFNLDSAAVSLPGANLNTPNLPAVPGADFREVPPIPSLETGDFASLDVSPELSRVGGDMTIPSMPQLGEWQKSLPAMPDLAGVPGQQLKELTNNPSVAAEKALTNMTEVSDATGALNEAEQLKNQSEVLQATEQLKDPSTAANELKKKAVDHFAGKQAEVQSAMSVMAKYKKKYSSIGSLSEIPKNDWLPRNGLKGQPFQKRFRVGLNSGFKTRGDTLLMDMYPNASYRLTGRIEAGLGANYRLSIDSDPLGLKQQNATWGLHFFTMVKTFKSVHLRLEMDGNSLFKSETADHPAYRDWRWTFHTGIQTNFKLGKHWAGNVQMLYNFDSSLKDGFPEKLSPRIGVQYLLK